MEAANRVLTLPGIGALTNIITLDEFMVAFD
jgi:hypothetical protein